MQTSEIAVAKQKGYTIGQFSTYLTLINKTGCCKILLHFFQFARRQALTTVNEFTFYTVLHGKSNILDPCCSRIIQI